MGNALKWPRWAVALFFAMVPTWVAIADEVDMQLVLAIDVSSSVNYDEYNLQMRGFAEAFRSDLVIEAITAGPRGRISVAATHWAGLNEQGVILDWQVIATAADARAYADLLDNVPRTFPYGGTAIAGALEHAYSLFSRDKNFSNRRVIDISGDGVVSIGRPPEVARDMIVGNGVIINGLPILNDEPELDVYYRDRVIGGLGAFIERANGYEDFARAIAEKLVREIRGTWQGV
ncbi:DUF1194 domain-containing protein [Sneathiella chungangensis]|uniref:DUF1194 domain-containing protein n=1 Tax=Sneathiella chungangensis TaxID=1418234 RepID=A0A845MI90_9PROT|nr:DUF1194 domain-containing protein [Sneathiella chungangensis]MZR23130.1 DUF1194 domain-containing protein [Sneathiella chungangensis]